MSVDKLAQPIGANLGHLGAQSDLPQSPLPNRCLRTLSVIPWRLRSAHTWKKGYPIHVIHPSSVAVSREHRRAKTDRLNTELLKRGFLGWLRGERGHCTMARPDGFVTATSVGIKGGKD